MEIEVALDGGQIDHAERTQFRGVVGAMLRHGLAGALKNARDARLAHEHVMRFFGEHEPGGAGERVERGFGERAQLELAVAIGEEREHEERQPVGRLLVERAEDARIVLVARAALQQRLGFLAAVTAEVAMQQVHHRPQMPPFLDVDLEQVAQVVLRRRRCAQVALLLDRGRLGVALGDDDPPEVGAVLARDFLPGRLALVLAKGDAPVGIGRIQEDAPAIVGHLHVVEMRPATGLHADRGAQVDVGGRRAVRPHVAPPIEKRRLPVLERALQRTIAAEIDVVGNLLAVVDAQGGSPMA